MQETGKGDVFSPISKEVGKNFPKQLAATHRPGAREFSDRIRAVLRERMGDCGWDKHRQQPYRKSGQHREGYL